MISRSAIHSNSPVVFQFKSVKYDFSARTHIVGILNVTPDSFSDGGMYLDPEIAVRHALEMIDEGADIIDIGGESTRPKSRAYGDGAVTVTVDEELRRVIPIIEKLARNTGVPISIDTYKSEVAAQALAAGACIVNDISGFKFDGRMPEVIAAAGASAIVMHIKGTPGTMQLNPEYDDLFAEVLEYLSDSVEQGRRAGIGQIIIDPGIGFGKRQEHNLQLLAGVSRFECLGCPILVGPSRKTFIGNILGTTIEDRLEGTLAAVVGSVLCGAHLVRVHDVKATKRAVMVADAMKSELIHLQDSE
ncbi:MAG: dihydropteroate synthase [Bacteroidota bacterium]